jgi:hypothetical protein
MIFLVVMKSLDLIVMKALTCTYNSVKFIGKIIEPPNLDAGKSHGIKTR